MIALIDNYDSFTYNLAQMIQSFGFCVKIFRNDQISIQKLKKFFPSHLIISPGPGTPKNSGICLEAIDFFSNKIPILGVCLGHQAIGQIFGAKLVYTRNCRHGKTSHLYHNQKNLFRNVPMASNIVRYHSLALSNPSKELEITAFSEDNVIMGIKHKKLPIFGVQFHPESYETEFGDVMIKNFFEEK